jgi:hypothetical protein
MNDALLYDLTEQLERIANSLEQLGEAMTEPIPAREAPKQEGVSNTAHLSLFLETLPTWQYNSLRRKLLPAGLAAKTLGISPAHLAALTRQGVIPAKGGRYDMLSLLMWLDSQANEERTEL